MNRIVPALLLAAALHAADNSTVTGLNRFAMNSYRALAPGSGNLVFSPWSISAALSMALAGARGQTAAGMAAVLGQHGPQAGYHEGLAALVEQLRTTGNAGPNALLFANGLWVQDGLAVQGDFRRTVEGLYRAPLSRLDFHGDPGAAAAEINSWTGRQTKGRIRELLPPGSLDGSVRLVLTSAVYFNGKWQSAFRTASTRPESFETAPGRTVQTSFMTQTGEFGYAAAPGVQILEMKYAGAPLAFDVLLPKTGGLADLEKLLTPEHLAGWFSDLGKRQVEVHLPKFRAEAGFSLRATLAHLGMPLAFAPAADFSGIDGRRDLQLADVRHKAFVDVTEEGTEAAAASGAMVSLISAPVLGKVVFRADRPFAFFIRDTGTGTILFAGRLAAP